MRVRTGYKDYVLEAMIFELRDVPGFTSELYIEKHDGAGVDVKQFFVPGIFDTKQSAAQATVLAGRKLIDAGRLAT